MKSDFVNESSNATYMATATFSDGSTQIVTDSADWSVDSEYANINSSGKLTTSAISSNQTVTIEANYTYDGVAETATKVVTIVDAPVTLSSLSITGDDFVNENSSTVYTATATFSDGSTQIVTGSTDWSVNASYASINSSGELTTLEVSSDMTITIHAAYTDSGITETATKMVTIVDVPVTLSSLSIAGDDFVNENSSTVYTATATFSDGSTQIVTGTTDWSVNSSYASINSSGGLTTSEVQSDVTITIHAGYTDSGITETATKVVTIVDVPVTLSSLAITGDDFVNENSSTVYTATATFSDGSTQIVTGTTDWSVNASYVSINSSGGLTTSEVSSDMTITIHAAYTDGGITETATKVVTIIDVPELNLPPNTPIIASPENGQYEVETPLDITTAAFLDPNHDAHSKSQWQISEQSDFAILAVDVTSNNYLTTFSVPHMVLKPNQKYYVRIRFYDVYSEVSEWSSTIEFTTSSFFEDLNSNGIPDADEVDDSVDFNLDHIPDIYQPETIKCVQTTDGSAYFGVEKISASIIEIEALEVIDPETISNTVNRPDDLLFGLISYRLRVNRPGDTVLVKIYFSGEIFESDTFFKYDTINGWTNYSNHTMVNDDGQSVTVELKDGGYGDSDGLSNGIIVDPGGIAAAESTTGGTVTSSSGSGGGGGCFIATAAFGSKFEKHVQLLRRFRDLYLMTHKIGRAFVNAYYTYSPPMADFIANHDMLRMMVRWSLLPLVGLSWMLIHFGIVFTLLTASISNEFFFGVLFQKEKAPSRNNLKLYFYSQRPCRKGTLFEYVSPNVENK